MFFGGMIPDSCPAVFKNLNYEHTKNRNIKTNKR